MATIEEMANGWQNFVTTTPQSTIAIIAGVIIIGGIIYLWLNGKK
ncbi:Uncharacterised protein [uncultured archaeon]|nr:Uncharacterised protein [uncultured archaeon]